MRKQYCAIATAAAFVSVAALSSVWAQKPAASTYQVQKAVKVGGEGGFDYVYADVGNRKLYIPRRGPTPPGRVTVFDLDTLAPAGEIANANGRGVAVDPMSGHGFASSKPVVMWDAKTLAPLKTIDVEGNPDGIFFDPFNARVYVFSHVPPFATVIDAAAGSVLGTIDLGGMPEQAVSDRKGRIYVDLEDKKQIAVIDAKAMKVVAHYPLGEQSGDAAGLAFDVKNDILFSAGSNPAVMVILKASTGKILATLPIGAGTDGAVFNPATNEAFSSQRDGTLSVIKEVSPTKFVVSETVKTMPGAKTLTLDSKTNRILLIAAELGPAPEAAPATPGARPAPRPMIPGTFSILVVSK
jgi:DNA-binding beta-propeller fold protein YncE